MGRNSAAAEGGENELAVSCSCKYFLNYRKSEVMAAKNEYSNFLGSDEPELEFDEDGTELSASKEAELDAELDEGNSL
ncbi:hypothetical protein RRG08_023254 [Elysia crispata]|uniref:Uncharacterized protein n=1 Tax=Elysia crispata TaxID=231223 RepID=A0AAE0ZPT9_9GAST|nr:hypothetical protein RRG08_023254 [Elysia crispata]